MNFSTVFANLLLFVSVFIVSTHGTSFYDLQAENIFNKPVSFADYKGKVVIVVNVASECGYTDNHYRELTELYNEYKDTGKLEILAFPCNQFGAQEPEGNQQIFQFVRRQYNVPFPMFSKIDVQGPNQHPVYKFLTESTAVTPQWNFWKYLLNHNGKPLGTYSPQGGVHAMLSKVRQAVKAIDVPEHEDL